jgi:hypothetical protein
MKTLAALSETADDNIEREREELTLLRLYVGRGHALPQERVEEFRARMSDTLVCFDLAIKSAAIRRRKMVQ